MSPGAALRAGRPLLALCALACGHEPPPPAPPAPDTQAPHVRLLSPSEGQVVAAFQVHVRGALEDDQGVVRASWSLNGAPPVDFTPSAAFTLEGLPLPGTNHLRVEAVDAAGNTGVAEVRFKWGTSLAAGLSHSAALRDGQLFTWGGNDAGQLGRPDAGNTPHPLPVPGLAPVRAVVAGPSSTLVLLEDGGAWAFAGSLIPQDTAADSFEASVSLPGGMQELLVYLPLYAEVRSLELGLEDGCAVSPAAAPERHVVFYGSSITQGGCAPRPGVSYPAIVSRRLGVSFTDLGFSAGARAEAPILDYLCTLPMDALVFDYDHNAPDADALEQTHLPAYNLLRAKRPALPILLASAPLALPDAEWLRRRQIVLETYRYAKAHGDARVGFVDGAAMYPPALRAECSVDGIHPNALGMHCMADAFEPQLRSLLQSI